MHFNQFSSIKFVVWHIMKVAMQILMPFCNLCYLVLQYCCYHVVTKFIARLAVLLERGILQHKLIEHSRGVYQVLYTDMSASLSGLCKCAKLYFTGIYCMYVIAVHTTVYIHISAQNRVGSCMVSHLFKIGTFLYNIIGFPIGNVQ